MNESPNILPRQRSRPSCEKERAENGAGFCRPGIPCFLLPSMPQSSYLRVPPESGNEALQEAAFTVDLLRHVPQDEHFGVQLLLERVSKKWYRSSHISGQPLTDPLHPVVIFPRYSKKRNGFCLITKLENDIKIAFELLVDC